MSGAAGNYLGNKIKYLLDATGIGPGARVCIISSSSSSISLGTTIKYL
jgi:hypothetical protein